MTFIRRLISPVFMKEMTQFSSRKRNFVMKCLFMVISFLIVVWVGIEDDGSSHGTVLCVTASLIGVITTLCVVPIMTAGLVSSEVESNTLPLLFLTHLTPWNIAQDKALARVVQIGYIIILVLPAFACGLLYGGISWLQVVGAFGYLLGTILLAAGCSILCGVFIRSYAGALFMTYILIVAILFLPMLIAEVAGLAMELVMMRMNPFSIVALYEGSTSTRLLWEWPWFLLFSGGTYLAGVLCASLKVGRMKRRGGALPGVKRERSLRQRFRRFYASQATPEQSGRNPIFWRDYHVAPFSFAVISRRFTFIFTYGMPIVMVAIFLFTNKSGFIPVSSVASILVLFSAWFFGTITLVIYGASVVSRERRRQTFPILMASGLSGCALAWGYLRSGVILVINVSVMELVGLAALIAAEDEAYLFFYVSAGIIAVSLVLWLSLQLVRAIVVSKTLTTILSGSWLCVRALLGIVALSVVAESDNIRVLGGVFGILINYFILIVAMWMSIRCKGPTSSVGWAMASLLGICILSPASLPVSAIQTN